MVQKSVLSDTPENLIEKYRQALEAEGIPVEKMILFGSYAKGKAKPWSDVDVCVVSSSFGKDPYQEMVRLKQLTMRVDLMIEPHPYSPADLADPLDPLAWEIQRTGKLV
ncbi:MAG: hypothetical protein A2784_04335 [Candidatus Chisholmbacteria bacterium RIFCSPHIGHO2_01_FULL_48_12]|uniref:Polymerase nucleotidyl transferase domain-containing protein n=1 Tax=Candidatus Chisholmbacteria bacterium RIFCSPHIGHO2_01_FULL_48_12 TaxID=1797589 RepID=A0A1G1VKL8_9BACT|nr:MAG: hypothetical protein A2784_04335 [Candidatus Chisholmbacteria bacterium RIFCSPHIGHO2_01_FULL_48_12]